MLVRNTVALTPSVEADRIAVTAKALAHPARVKTINIPQATPGCIGGDVGDKVELAKSTVSENLSILKNAGIVTGAMKYHRVFCSLDPAAVAPIRTPEETIAASAPTAEAGTCHTLQGYAPGVSA